MRIYIFIRFSDKSRSVNEEDFVVFKFLSKICEIDVS